MTGAVAYVDMHRARDEVNVDVDLAEQRAILAQIERERSAARHPSIALHGSSPSFDESQLRTAGGVGRSSESSRRRSNSLERSMAPEELMGGFTSMLAADAEEAMRSSPGRAVRASPGGSDRDEEGTTRWDIRRGDDSGARRRIFEEDEMGCLEPPSLSTPAEAVSTSSSSSASRPPANRRSHHRQHMSLPASHFTSAHTRDHSVRFDESLSNVEEQRAILEEIEREQRQQGGTRDYRGRQERGREDAPMHRQHQSLPVLDSFGLDDAAVQEQMAIMREIERQRQQERQQQQQQQEREEAEERQRWQREEERPAHRLSKSVPAEFFEDTSFEEQRAILERISRENGGGGREGESQDRHHRREPPAQEAAPQAPTHRHSKSFPAARGSLSEEASEKIGYRKSGGSRASRDHDSGEDLRRSHLMSLDERVERKRGQYGSSFAPSSNSADRRQQRAGDDHFERTTSAAISSTKKPSRHRPSFSDDLVGSTSSSSRGAPTASASGDDAARASQQEAYRRSGRHTVLLVDGRDAVTRSGGRKKSVTCAGCSKRLSVSRSCEVVFCPRCETLTPAALSDEVGAWGQS